MALQDLKRANEEDRTKEENEGVHVKDVPDYFSLDVDLEKFKCDRITIPLYEGFLIQLSQFENFEHYVTDKVKRARFSEIRRLEKKLHKCFDISYRFYQDDIDSSTYSYLFKTLKSLTTKRFQEKGEQNYELQYFESFEKEILPLLQRKEAGIFVIYDGDKPISIRVDVHFQKIIYGLLRTYDTDYGKFGLGDIDMLENIRWGLGNNYLAIDLLKGYFEYKKKWCTNTYRYMHHIIYRKKPQTLIPKGRVLASRIRLRNRLLLLAKSMRLGNLKRSVLKRMGGTSKKSHDVLVEEWSTNTTTIPNLRLVDIESGECLKLRKPLYDFLYKENLKKSEMDIYIVGNHTSRIFVKAKQLSEKTSSNN